MSLFICFKSFLVLSVGRIYLAELNFHRTTFIEDNLKRMSGKPGNRHSEFRSRKGIATGARTGIGKRIEVGFKGRKKKDAINDHILLCDKT